MFQHQQDKVKSTVKGKKEKPQNNNQIDFHEMISAQHEVMSMGAGVQKKENEEKIQLKEAPVQHMVREEEEEKEKQIQEDYLLNLMPKRLSISS
jgi:hypothetical protein